MPDGFSKKLRRALRRKPFNPRPEVLLCQGLPQPLHGTNPRTILGWKWWDRTRKEAYRSTGHRCLTCGDSGVVLNGHEVYEIDYLLDRAEYVEAVPLCNLCHGYIHIGRLSALVGKGEISTEQYDQVLSHGITVLRNAGLKLLPVYAGPTAEWGDWRLVIGGEEYPPKFPRYEDWLSEFG